MVKKRGRPKKNSASPRRMIKVYARDLDQHKRWEEAAKNYRASNSRFFREIIDSYIAGDLTTKRDQEYEKRILDLTNQNKLLAIENNRLQASVDRLHQNLKVVESELTNVKYGSFLDKDFSGERELNVKLIELFKDKKRLRNEDITTLLHLDPNDEKANKIILEQLNILLDYKLIIQHRGGYEWKK